MLSGGGTGPLPWAVVVGGRGGSGGFSSSVKVRSSVLSCGHGKGLKASFRCLVDALFSSVYLIRKVAFSLPPFGPPGNHFRWAADQNLVGWRLGHADRVPPSGP